jgi:dephospho-CoA kinase
MKVIFLTGGIGSGKSTVSSILRELGAVVIDSDKLGHDVLNPETPGWQEVLAAFGKDILTLQNTIDRKKLAGIVFKNPEALEKLNSITHHRVNAEIDAQLQQLQEQKTDAVFVEAALIVESNWLKHVDQIWVVKTPIELTLKRLEERGLNETEARARMAAQTPPEDIIKDGLIVIHNDGTINDLKDKVAKLWHDLLADK